MSKPEILAAWHKKRIASARAIQDARQKKGLTVSELSYRSGVSADAIYKLERGVRYPNPKTSIALASALGVTEAELMGG
jgi:transcriptional regulator with XRE-family HTH domain